MGTDFSYHLSSPVLSPPISSIALRRGSKESSADLRRSGLRLFSVRLPNVLDDQLLHVGMPGGGNHPGVRASERRTALPQNPYRGVDIHLLILRQAVPPRPEFIRVFDFPFHWRSITRTECAVKREKQESAGRLGTVHKSSGKWLVASGVKGSDE